MSSLSIFQWNADIDLFNLETGENLSTLSFESLSSHHRIQVLPLKTNLFFPERKDVLRTSHGIVQQIVRRRNPQKKRRKNPVSLTMRQITIRRVSNEVNTEFKRTIDRPRKSFIRFYAVPRVRLLLHDVNAR